MVHIGDWFEVSLQKKAVSHPENGTSNERKRMRIGQALGLLVQPGTRIAALTPAAYQPCSLQGTLLA